MKWLVLKERNYNSSQQDEQVVVFRVVIAVVEEVEEFGFNSGLGDGVLNGREGVVE